jgi:hypothetical protein
VARSPALIVVLVGVLLRFGFLVADLDLLRDFFFAGVAFFFAGVAFFFAGVAFFFAGVFFFFGFSLLFDRLRFGCAFGFALVGVLLRFLAAVFLGSEALEALLTGLTLRPLPVRVRGMVSECTELF